MTRPRTRIGTLNCASGGTAALIELVRPNTCPPIRVLHSFCVRSSKTYGGLMLLIT